AARSGARASLRQSASSACRRRPARRYPKSGRCRPAPPWRANGRAVCKFQQNAAQPQVLNTTSTRSSRLRRELIVMRLVDADRAAFPVAGGLDEGLVQAALVDEMA